MAAAKTAANVYTGALYTGTGRSFLAQAFDPAKVVPKQVGAATLTFADGNTATFAYTVGGLSQTKQVTREIIAPPGTVCQ